MFTTLPHFVLVHAVPCYYCVCILALHQYSPHKLDSRNKHHRDGRPVAEVNAAPTLPVVTLHTVATDEEFVNGRWAIPLTTIFTPPADYSWPISEVLSHPTTCFPSYFNHAGPEYLGYYSPGICSSGYTVGCTPSHSARSLSGTESSTASNATASQSSPIPGPGGPSLSSGATRGLSSAWCWWRSWVPASPSCTCYGA